MGKSQNRKPFQALRDLFHPVDLTHGTCWRTILQFSLPVILSYLLQQVYTISDAAIVGQTLTAGRRALRPAAWRHGRREVRTGAGAIPPGRGAAWRQKKCREACPPGWTRLDEKKCGEDALSPPLAVTADTRFPPVRRSSPKRTRCRPVPYALAVRRLPGLRSCVP